MEQYTYYSACIVLKLMNYKKQKGHHVVRLIKQAQLLVPEHLKPQNHGSTMHINEAFFMLHLSFILKTLAMSSQALSISHWCERSKELTVPVTLQLHLNIMLKE